MILASLAMAALGADFPAPAEVEHRWGAIQGLMAGIAVAHAVQPLAAVTGAIPWNDKYWVATGGGVLYGATFAGLLAEKRWALRVAVGGPVLGLSTVLGGWALGKMGVIELQIRPDAFQLAAGVLQAGAIVDALRLLKHDPRFAASVVVLPADGGAVVRLSLALP